MQLFLAVKSLTKRRSAVIPVPITLDPVPSTLRALIVQLVEREIALYQDRQARAQTPDAMSTEAIDNLALSGAIRPGSQAQVTPINREEAIAHATQSVADGIVRLWVNDVELTDLEAPLSLKEGDTLTLIRLASLAGRLW